MEINETKEQEANTSVDKKYTDFMDEISSDDLYEGLLAYGFFAEKLPPIFTAIPFFEHCKTVAKPFESGWNEWSVIMRTQAELPKCPPAATASLIGNKWKPTPFLRTGKRKGSRGEAYRARERYIQNRRRIKGGENDRKIRIFCTYGVRIFSLP